MSQKKPTMKECLCCKKLIENKENKKYCRNCARFVNRLRLKIYSLEKRVENLGGTVISNNF